MNDVRILGAGMTPFGRHPEGSLRTLAEEATRRALGDASIGPESVGMVFFGNAADGVLHGQEMVRGEVALRHSGLRGVPIVNVENACASSSSAFYLASMAITAGAADVVLAVGVEKMTHPDKARSFAAVATAVDLDEEAELRTMVAGALLGGPTPIGGVPARSPLMDLYAGNAARYMDATGATAADFAAVSVKNRRHAALNPAAQFRTPVTLQEVLASRMIADPLRLLMCSPVGDGAAALVVTSEDFARRAGQSGSATVAVEASVLTSGGAHPDAARPAERAARSAYEWAGLGPLDIDLAEVHDACAPAELWLYEELGFCAPGEAAKLVGDGTVALGGRLPVNVSGGLLGRGHPIGATGAAQLVELVDQLRGRAGDRQVDGARIALAQNGGGMLDGGDEAAALVTILSRR